MKEKLNNFWTLDRHHAAGFTLVELIVVIAILAILAGVAVPAYSGYIKKAEQAADEQLLAALNTAYAAACMENGEYDMKKLSFGPAATVKDGVVKMNKYDEQFQFYFGDGEFKYFDTLGFISAEGVFKGNTMAAIKQAFKEYWNNGSHSFKNEGDVEMLLGVFDNIGGMFSIFPEDGFDVEEFLNNFSDDLLAATGLGDIFGGINDSMQLSQEEIDAYEAKLGRELTEEELSTIKGNKAVMQFAQAAAGADTDATKTDVDNFINIVKNALDSEWQTENEPEGGYAKYMENYFLENGDPLAVQEYNETGNTAILNEFLNGKNGVNLSGRDAAMLSLAAEKAGTKNKTGINTLGSLYALSAGYFSQPGVTAPSNLNLGSFDAFVYAVSNDPVGFSKYYESKGGADMDAYLSFMGALSTGDVDLTDENAFSGMGGYIADLLK